jgi:LPS sulfotransferase NodH
MIDGRGRDAARPVRFVVLSTQRSGTTWLIQKLNNHPQVGGYGELLLPVDAWPEWPADSVDRPRFKPYAAQRGAGRSRLWRPVHLFSYLDHVFAPRRDLHAIGFKLMYSQAKIYPEVWAYLLSRRVRVVHLVRANLLDVVLSRAAMARRTNVHARSPDEVERVVVRLEPGRLINDMKRLDRQTRIARAALRVSRLPTHEVAYEDLRTDDRRLPHIFGFVGAARDLGAAEGRGDTMKLAPDSHRDSIENFDEVRDAVKATRFAGMLRE